MQIFIARNNQQEGPYDLATIKANLANGSLSPNDLAWYEGAAGWAPLSTIPGLAVPPPPIPPAAPPPSVVVPLPAVSAPGATPKRKSALAVIGSILVGVLLLSLGLFKIVRSATRLLASQSTTQAVASPSPSQKSVPQETASSSVAPENSAQFKTISYPTQNPQVTFQLPKESSAQTPTEGTTCFTYGFVVCVTADPKNTVTVEESEIKDAEKTLTKELTTGLTTVLQKQGGTDVRVNKTGHFKTAKNLLIFYSEANYKSAQGTEMIFLNHMLLSKKGLFVIQGAAKQADKDSFYKEMRRVLDSLSL